MLAPQYQSSYVEYGREADEDGGEACYEALPEVGGRVRKRSSISFPIMGIIISILQGEDVVGWDFEDLGEL